MGAKALFRAFKDSRRFRQLEPEERRIVFYAENSHSWVHFAPIIEHLTGILERRVCYVTSSVGDPILETRNERIEPYYVGDGTACTYFFMNLEADVAVLTMPDLERFHKKRSRVHPVHYVYVFHSIVSTHMIYRPGAFDHYDTIFAVGPHHLAEIRATEEAHGFESKQLVRHGYGRLDSILESRAGRPPAVAAGPEAPVRVLIAPSWGPDGLLETRGEELIRHLLAAGCHVTLRPHPETSKRWPRVLRGLDRFAGDQRFVLETDIASRDSLLASHVMISDWSGAALEYAFGLERPVLFIDVPRKVNNPEYEKIGHEPIEASIRGEIGEVLAPDRLADVGLAVARLTAEPWHFRDQIRAARERTVFHLGGSGAVGAEHLARLADELAA